MAAKSPKGKPLPRSRQVEKRPVGRPPWIPTEETLREVEECGELGLTEELTARVLGIAVSTLCLKKTEYLEFAEALKRGRAKGVKFHANNLKKCAEMQTSAGGNANPAASIFYLKAKADWRDKSEGDLQVNIDARQDNRKQTVIMSGDALSAQLMDYEDVLRTDGAVTKALTAKVPGNGEGSVPGNGEVHDAGSESDVIEAEVEGDPQ